MRRALFWLTMTILLVPLVVVLGDPFDLIPAMLSAVTLTFAIGELIAERERRSRPGGWRPASGRDLRRMEQERIARETAKDEQWVKDATARAAARIDQLAARRVDEHLQR